MRSFEEDQLGPHDADGTPLGGEAYSVLSIELRQHIGGKWKGALTALARRTPPPAGTYMISARGREVAEIVADALRPMCGLYVRGI